MKLGANDVSAVKIGATDVNKVYLGSNLVWEKAVGTLLLDLYPNAAAAYSLRKLRTAYTGAAIEVRVDTTGQPTYDIGFDSNGELDTTDLLSKAGSNDAYVSTWYDQSGGGNDATQSNASNQPQIVSSGSLITQNGKPNLQFDGSNDYFDASAVTTGNPKSIFIPTKFTSISSTEKVIFDSITTNQSLLYKSSSNNIGIGFGSFILTSYTATTDFTLYSIFHNGSTSNVYIDSSTQIVNNQNLGTNAFNGLRIGAVRGSASLFFNGFIPEFIMWGSEQSSNRAGIESNINSYYNMYWDGSQTGLLDDYSNAAAAYSLRALSSAYTGAAIEVRKTVAGVTSVQDIGFLYDGSLDRASLLSFAGSDDVFVAKWYDQSGNGNDASETTESGQASIVLSGVLNTTNGNVAAFGKSNTAYATGYSVFTAADGTYSGFVVSKLVDSFDGVMALNNLSSGGGGEIFRYFNTSSTTFRIQSWDSSGVAPVLVTEPISANSNAISSFIRGLDSVTTSSNSLTNSLLGLGAPRKNVEERLLIMGYNGATNGLESYFSEAILYPSDQTSNRVGIESNINSNYNVFWDGSQTGILDDYPNAEAAYSLRALNSAYTSSAIRVRRSSDNAERDIGLLYDGSLDTSSLLSFVGAGDGFVTTWYDQSGEGNDAAQGSASKQPKIVSNGSVITENGKPSVEFNGTTDYIQNQLSVGATVTSFAVSKIVSEPDYNFIYDSFGTNSRLRLGLWFTQEYFADNGDGLIVEATTASDGNQHLFFAKHTNSDVSISVNQDTLQTVESTNFSQNSEHWNIGARNDGAEHFLEGTIQELILYPSDQSSDRSGIETNINNHYTIY